MKDVVKIFITLLMTLSSSGEQVEVEVEIIPPIATIVTGKQIGRAHV